MARFITPVTSTEAEAPPLPGYPSNLELKRQIDGLASEIRALGRNILILEAGEPVPGGTENNTLVVYI